MDKSANIKAALEYAIAKLESQETMSVEEREMYKKLIIERENLNQKDYKASWNPLWSIISHLAIRAGEEIIKNL